jgi:hypothetical protein
MSLLFLALVAELAGLVGGKLPGGVTFDPEDWAGKDIQFLWENNQRFLAAIALCRALGGGWQTQEGPGASP